MDNLAQADKRQKLKSIIMDLHSGISATEAKDRFEREVGNVSSGEIAAMEQELIDEGLSPDEIKKFCNVHALIFQSALEKSATGDTSPAHPIYLFKLENREIEKLVASLKSLLAERERRSLAEFKDTLRTQLLTLKNIDTHYTRKEQLLFPYLEKHGFPGPSKVMWAKDNEVRDFFRHALEDLPLVETQGDLDKYIQHSVDPLATEIESMIVKEENILFPTSLEKLQTEDWIEILRESEDVGYIFIQKPEEADVLARKLEEAVCEEPEDAERTLAFPSGNIRLRELMYLLNSLPIDITYVDANDKVAYVSENKDRIFTRPRAIIGREVRNCHPPQSVDRVEKILTYFKEGKRDSFDFRINFKGKHVYIAYFALRDSDGKYLGTVEITQDIAPLKNLEGEKRLMDETFVVPPPVSPDR